MDGQKRGVCTQCNQPCIAVRTVALPGAPVPKYLSLCCWKAADVTPAKGRE